MNIARSIRIGCARKGMNQKDLADAIDMTPATISLLVTGKRKCNQNTLEAMSKACDLSVSEFIALGE